MNIEVLQKSKQIEDIIYKEFKSYIIEFALKYTVEKNLFFNEDGSKHSDDEFFLKYLLSNPLMDKNIEIQITYTKHSKNYYLNKDFWIENINTNSAHYRNKFRLKDYCTFRKITFPKELELGFCISNEDELNLYIIKYISFIKDVLAIEEMQKILFSDYWINVPIDYSPYK
jgi:hypothetical protein